MLRLFKSRRPLSDSQFGVLVVDDDPAFCHLMESALKKLGYHVSTASNGKEAMRLARLNSFNIGVVDYYLPDMNGLELFRKLKSAQPEVEVLLLSARATMEAARDAIIEGAFGFLQKPISTEDLATVLAKANEKQKLAQEHARIVARLMAVNEMFMAMSGQVDVEGIERASIDKLIEIFGFDFASLHVLEDGVLKLRRHKGLPPKVVERKASLPCTEEMIKARCREANGYGLFQDEAEFFEGEHFHCCVMPLHSPSGFLGAVCVGFTRDRQIHPHEDEVLAVVGQHIALALEKANLYESARKAHRRLAETQRQMIDSEKMSTLGTLAAGFAHELRNPLNSIILQIKVLERSLAKDLSPLQQEIDPVLRAIRDEMGRIESFIDEFLFFAKPEKCRASRFDVFDLFSEIRDHVRDEIEARGVELTLERKRPLTVMRSDRDQLKLALLHLVNNALGAMRAGGRLSLTVEGDERAIVTVSDTGEGIGSPEKVFSMFYSTKERGTGLGLPIVQQIVTTLRGKVDFETESGKGTTFRIELPWDYEAESA